MTRCRRASRAARSAICSSSSRRLLLSDQYHQPTTAPRRPECRLQPSVTFWPPAWNDGRFFLTRFALDGEEVDANHRSPARLSARPTATAAVGAIVVALIGRASWRRTSTFRNGSNSSTGVPKRSCSASAKPSTRDAPPLSMMRSMRSVDGRRLEEVERLLDFEQHVLGHRAQHRHARLRTWRRRPACPSSAARRSRTAGSAPSAPLRCRRCRRSRCRA